MNLRQEFFKVDPEHESTNQVDPEYQSTRSDYMVVLERVKSMKPVNDHIVKGIASIKEYTGIFAQNEPHFQLLMKVVEEH